MATSSTKRFGKPNVIQNYLVLQKPIIVKTVNYTVVIMNDTNAVGHIPRRISYICKIFLRIHNLLCTTRSRQYPWDLEQGGGGTT